MPGGEAWNLHDTAEQPDRLLTPVDALTKFTEKVVRFA